MRRLLSLFLLLTGAVFASDADLIMRYVDTTTISNDATVQISLSDNPLYMLQLSNIVPVTDGAHMRVTVNAFSADYAYHRGSCLSSSTSYDSGADGSTANIPPITNIGNDAGESASGNLFIPNAASASLLKPMWLHGSGFEADGTLGHYTVAGYYTGATTALTSTTLALSTGNYDTGYIDKFEMCYHEVSDIGKTYNSATFISRTEISDDATVDIGLTGTYMRWVVVVLGMRPETDATSIIGQIGTSGGIKSADYARHNNKSDSGDSAYSGGAGVSTFYAIPCINPGNAAGENSCYIASIPNAASTHKLISSVGSMVDSNGDARMVNGSGSWTGGTDQLTTYRIEAAADNVDSGIAYLFGISAPAATPSPTPSPEAIPFEFWYDKAAGF